MKKAKKTKPPERKTALDRVTARLRMALRREITNIIEIGKLERVETAILTATRERRVDEDAAWAICEKLAPADDDHADDADDQDHGGETAAVEAPEITAILEGPPPAVPPPAPNPPPTDFALRDFDQAISALKRLMTKPAA
jgi:hypothetical protein